MIVELINVGRAKVCKKVEGLHTMQEVLHEVRKHLASDEVALVEKESTIPYTDYEVVVGGFRTVGMVRCS